MSMNEPAMCVRDGYLLYFGLKKTCVYLPWVVKVNKGSTLHIRSGKIGNDDNTAF